MPSIWINSLSVHILRLFSGLSISVTLLLIFEKFEKKNSFGLAVVFWLAIFFKPFCKIKVPVHVTHITPCNTTFPFSTMQSLVIFFLVFFLMVMIECYIYSHMHNIIFLVFIYYGCEWSRNVLLRISFLETCKK